MSSLRHDDPPRDEQRSVSERGGAGTTPPGSHSADRSPPSRRMAADPSGRPPDDGVAELRPATVAGALRLAAGISEDERALLVRRLARLDAQLARYRADQVDLELSVKDRGTRGQRLTLECWIAGRPRLVASSADHDLDVAVSRVREGVRRQIDDTATRREPRNNRLLRRTTRTGAGTARSDPDGPPVGGPPAGPSPEAD